MNLSPPAKISSRIHFVVAILDKAALRRRALAAVVGIAAVSVQVQPATGMPAMADCIFLQQSYLNRTTARLSSEARAAVADAFEQERKSYANVQIQPDPAQMVAQIKSLLTVLSQPDLPQQSMNFTQDSLAGQETMLCWMDYFAKRPHSFPAPTRAAYVESLRAEQQQALAAAMAREAARPDDPKTPGRGARGN